MSVMKWSITLIGTEDKPPLFKHSFLPLHPKLNKNFNEYNNRTVWILWLSRAKKYFYIFIFKHALECSKIEIFKFIWISIEWTVHIHTEQIVYKCQNQFTSVTSACTPHQEGRVWCIDKLGGRQLDSNSEDSKVSRDSKVLKRFESTILNIVVRMFVGTVSHTCFVTLNSKIQRFRNIHTVSTPCQ